MTERPTQAGDEITKGTMGVGEELKGRDGDEIGGSGMSGTNVASMGIKQEKKNTEEHQEFSYHEPSRARIILYDFFLWIFSVTFDCFFREIRPRGAYKLPRSGPVIFVAAPHANQFIDPMLLMQQVKKEAGRRISFMIAAISYKHFLIGPLSKCQLAIPVARQQDNLKKRTGKIRIDLDKDPLLVIGEGTKFLSECSVRGLFALPNGLGASEILSVESDTQLRLKKEFKRSEALDSLLSRGTTFKSADKVNQKQVYNMVFQHLAHGHCLGIFPEGGSHDRTDLLPLKAGVAIMALGAMSEYPGCSVKVVPCGMNYFSAHKFRSRAVIEFGNPIEIPPEMVKRYQNPDTSRETVKELLECITDGLKAVTVTCKDFETLMVVQAARRLYASFAHQLPLPLIVEMNRRLVKGYETYKDREEVKVLKTKIMKYNSLLKQISLPDHYVAECDHFGKGRMFIVFLYRLLKLIVLMSFALPGAVLYSPVFVCAKFYSTMKAREALANSSVKIKANDVIATWKILIAMGLSPALYLIYAKGAVLYLSRRGLCHNTFINWILMFGMIVAVTYAALITGEQGLDIFKSIRPLYLTFTSNSYMKEVKKMRNELAEEITEVVNSLGPQLYPNDFNLLEKNRRQLEIDSDEEEEMKTQELRRRRLKNQKKKQISRVSSIESVGDLSSDSKQSSISDNLSLMNSDSSLTDIPFFSDYHLHKNANNKYEVLDYPSSHSSILSDNEHDPTTGDRIELNFGKCAPNSSISNKIRDRVREKRENDSSEHQL